MVSRSFRLFFAGVTLAASLLVPLCNAQSGFSAIYGFTGQNGDGAEPNGILAIAPNGVLYGATAGGGSGPCNVNSVPSGCGTVFELKPPAVPGAAWTESVLYRFAGANGDGWSPYGGVLIGNGGRLYGTTIYGGIGCGAWGCGIVFELTPPKATGAAWSEKVVHAFTGENGDGFQPVGSLTLGKNGELYGLTSLGGSSNCGAVYRLTPPAATGQTWIESILYSFAGPSFSAPQGYPADMKLIIDAGGALYGATPFGGRFGYGVVFKILPPKSPGGPWTAADLFSFNESDGASPSGGVVAGSTGTLYGSALAGGSGSCSAGCGAIFELTSPAAAGGPWQEAVICDIGRSCGGPSVAFPQTNMVRSGNGVLYGTGPSVLFALQPPLTPGSPWIASTIYNFNTATAGVQPSGLAINEDGVLFGTTMQGGACNYCGAVFRWAP